MKWIKAKHPGVRYRLHESRRHGIGRDKYFVIRYRPKKGGGEKQEALGWASEGWTEAKAVARLSELKENKRIGQGPVTLKEKREIQAERKREEEAAKAKEKRESVMFGDFFATSYLPTAKTAKAEKSWKVEEIYFRNFLKPVMEKMRFKDIAPVTVERVKKRMLDMGKAPRTVQYALAVIRQVWNMAKRDGVVDTESPTKRVKVPKVDNKRLRFFTPEEAKAILDYLKGHDLTAYRMTLLSLMTGMRLSEIANLKWGAVDLAQGVVHIRDAKGKRNRVAYLNGEVAAMFRTMEEEREEAKERGGSRNGQEGQGNEKWGGKWGGKWGEKLGEEGGDDDRGGYGGYIFLSRRGRTFTAAPKAFWNALAGLKLNEGREDARDKVNFHSCRHTFASWLVGRGVGLYEVQRLLGHQSAAMTERYSHLTGGMLKQAAMRLEGALDAKTGEVVRLSG